MCVCVRRVYLQRRSGSDVHEHDVVAAHGVLEELQTAQRSNRRPEDRPAVMSHKGHDVIVLRTYTLFRRVLTLQLDWQSP